MTRLTEPQAVKEATLNRMAFDPDPIIPAIEPEFARPNYVSLWVGTFASVEEAEAYFGIPDEIGVYLPPEAFAADFDLGEFPPETLEVNFEQVAPRSLPDLLRDATFSASFLDQAVAAAAGQGVHKAQGIALLYDFDYRLKPTWREQAGPLRFIAALPFVRTSPRADLQPFQDLARQLDYPMGAVLLLAVVLEEVTKKRRQERGDGAGHVSAREFCEYLLVCRGKDTPTILDALGLRRSEDVGRVIFGLVAAGRVRREESDSEADFQGLFALSDYFEAGSRGLLL